MSQYIKAVAGFFTGKNDEKQTKLKTIANLKEKLIAVGYHPEEVEYFINTDPTANLEDVIQSLKAQLEMAQKCKDAIKHPNL